MTIQSIKIGEKAFYQEMDTGAKCQGANIKNFYKYTILKSGHLLHR